MVYISASLHFYISTSTNTIHTKVPKENYESFQVLKYKIGQKYNTHHDASPQQTKLACGTRILTFFLYLSDVEEGGETAFPTLGISVKPKKGKALLWPSTMDNQVSQSSLILSL